MKVLNVYCRRRDRKKIEKEAEEKKLKEGKEALIKKNEELEEENRRLMEGQKLADRTIKDLKVCQSS